MSGWIKLHRQIVTSSKFADPDILRLWILCLTKAAHKEKVVVIDRQEIPLLPGQFVTGRFSLDTDYNAGLAPRKKIKDTTLWNWLQRLEKWGDLDIKSTNKYSVVTVLKWSEYQETLTTEPQQIDNRLTTEPQQFDTNKNVKNLENLKKSTTTTADVHTQVFGTLMMNGLMRDYIMKLKGAGYTDHFIQELMLETGESSSKPNLRLMQTIGDRWTKEGIYTRIESKQRKNANKNVIPLVPKSTEDLPTAAELMAAEEERLQRSRAERDLMFER